MNQIIPPKNQPDRQGNGELLLVVAVLCAATAQGVLIVSASDQAIFWDVSAWFKNLGQNASPIPGLSLYLLAGLLFILGLRQLGNGRSASATHSIEPRTPQPARFGFWLTSAGLALLIAVYTADPQRAAANGYALSLLWLLSIGLLIFSVLHQAGWQPPQARQLLGWIKTNRHELLLLLALLAAALLVRTIDLELHPYSMVNDEGEMGKGALCLLSGTCRNIFAIAWASQPLVSYLPHALSIGLLGHSAALPVRMVSVVTGMLAVVSTYLFARETFGKKTAFLAALLLATFPFHVHFSRVGVNNIIDSFTSPLLLWLLMRAIRKGSAGYFLAAGIVSGLCLYTYPGSRLAIALAAALLVAAILTRRGFLRAQFSNLMIFILAALITVAPLLGTYSTTSGEFNGRLNSVSIFNNGVLQAEMKQSGLTATQVLVEQFFKSSLPFISLSGPMNFFNTPRAYLSTIAAIFLMLGLALSFWKLLDLRYFILLAWFFGPICLGSALTAGPPSNQRMLGSSPAAVILAALAMLALLQGLSQNTGPRLRQMAALLLVAAISFNAYQDLSFYFGTYRSGHYFEDLSNEITYESHTIISELGSNGRFYLIGAPMTFTIFGNFDYFSPNVEKFDLDTITPDSIASLPKDKTALFLAIPSRKADLQKIAAWIPNGEWSAVKRRFRPEEELYFAYKVKAEQLQAFQP